MHDSCEKLRVTKSRWQQIMTVSEKGLYAFIILFTTTVTISGNKQHL